MPSRFLDELPEAHVEVTESKGGFGGYGNYGASRFDEMTHFGSSYGTPGWQRAQAARPRRLRRRRRRQERRIRRRRRRVRRRAMTRWTTPQASPPPDRGGSEAAVNSGARPRALAPPAHHRGRAGRQIDRHRLRLRDRRPRVSPEIRQRQRHRRRRQQAHHRSSTRRARSGWWIVSWSGCEGRLSWQGGAGIATTNFVLCSSPRKTDRWPTARARTMSTWCLPPSRQVLRTTVTSIRGRWSRRGSCARPAGIRRPRKCGGGDRIAGARTVQRARKHAAGADAAHAEMGSSAGAAQPLLVAFRSAGSGSRWMTFSSTIPG